MSFISGVEVSFLCRCHNPTQQLWFTERKNVEAKATSAEFRNVYCYEFKLYHSNKKKKNIFQGQKDIFANSLIYFPCRSTMTAFTLTLHDSHWDGFRTCFSFLFFFLFCWSSCCSFFLAQTSETVILKSKEVCQVLSLWGCQVEELHQTLSRTGHGDKRKLQEVKPPKNKILCYFKEMCAQGRWHLIS